jgi:NAD(P)H dehydrogenase (quinone)
MILVMAASGKVGGATIHSLLARGTAPSEVIAGVRNPHKAGALEALGVGVRKADYQDCAGMTSAFMGVETVVLIPTMTLPPARCVEYGNALSAARGAGVKRIVFLSIQAATPQSRFTVAPFILFAECSTRLSGMEWTLARMSLYADPLVEWLPTLVESGRLPYPLQHGRIAYVTRADVGRSLAAIACNPNLNGKIVELTGPASLSMPELAGVLSEATGTSISFTPVSDDEYRDICREEHIPEEVIEILVTMYHAVEAQEFSHVSSDIEMLTGARPESISEAIAKQLLLGRAAANG